MVLTSGTTIGAYKIDREIGRGGMGVIFLAHDTRLGRAVALKALPEDVAQDPDRLQRFEREARVLASLNHPNIAAIYGLEEAEGRKYLALEHVEGETLADRIARGPLPLSETLDITIQVAGGMEAAHDAGVVHRDLKPANVMITPNDQVKILDFGLAKGRVATDESGLAKSPALVDSPATLSSPTLAHSPTFLGTMPGMILGTAAYLSPEQARGKVVDRRTDIWSFGCLLYECLTGRLAFEGETVSDTIARILERPMDWSALPKATPPRLRELLERCLERDPKRRLRDIGDARLTLEEIRSGRHATLEPVPAPASSRRGILLAAAALILGAAIGFLGGHVLSGGRSEGVSYFSMPLPRGTQFSRGDTDGRTLAVIGRPLGSGRGDSSHGRLYVRRRDEPEFHEIPGTEGVIAAFLSPDGRTLEYWAPAAEQSTDLRRYRMPADRSAPPVPVGDVAPNWDDNAVWLPSGDLILSVDDGQSYMRLSANGTPGPSKPFRGAIRGARYHPEGRPLPDGRVFLHTIWYEGNLYHQGISLLDPPSGRITPLLQDGDSPVYRDGVLCFARLDVLFAQKFDPRSLKLQGPPVAIMNGLRQDQTSTNATFGLSPDGTLFYEPGGNVGRDRGLVIVNHQGDVSEWSSERRPYEYGLRASPDGSRVAVQINNPKAITELWISRRGDPRARRVRTRPGSDVLGDAWSPDGQWVAFCLNGADSTDGIYVVDKDAASEPFRVAAKPKPTSFLIPSSWSADGTLAATLVEGNQVAIWGVRVPPGKPALGTPRRLLGGETQAAVPSYSPDGHLLAYNSNESGTVEVYLTAWNGEATTGEPIPVSRGGGALPRWSRDGKKLYFTSQGKMMSMEVTRSPSLGVSSPAQAWNVGALRVPTNSIGDCLYDLLPDGGLVAVQASEEEGNVTEIHVALHFDEVVRQKLRAAAK